jgi:hypothetical protein
MRRRPPPVHGYEHQQANGFHVPAPRKWHKTYLEVLDAAKALRAFQSSPNEAPPSSASLLTSTEKARSATLQRSDAASRSWTVLRRTLPGPRLWCRRPCVCMCSSPNVTCRRICMHGSETHWGQLWRACWNGYMLLAQAAQTWHWRCSVLSLAGVATPGKNKNITASNVHDHRSCRHPLVRHPSTHHFACPAPSYAV